MARHFKDGDIVVRVSRGNLPHEFFARLIGRKFIVHHYGSGDQCCYTLIGKITIDVKNPPSGYTSGPLSDGYGGKVFQLKVQRPALGLCNKELSNNLGDAL